MKTIRERQGERLKHERVTEEIRELAALYALGALTQHEARSFEIHLRDCPICQSELIRLEHAATGIGLAVQEVDTPEYLRDLLLARTQRKPALSDSVAASCPEDVAQNAPPQIEESKSRGKKVGSKFDWALRIVFIVLVLAGLIAFNNLQMRNARLQTQVSNSKAAMDDLKKGTVDQKKQPVDFEQFLEMAGEPGMRIAWLVGQTPAPSSSGTVIWDTVQHRYLLMGSFPQVPQGKAYQLWLVTPTQKVSAGLIKANPKGPTFATAPITENVPDADSVGITLEPDTGSSSPTTRFSAFGQFH
jgi:hypothetical protein